MTYSAKLLLNWAEEDRNSSHLPDSKASIARLDLDCCLVQGGVCVKASLAEIARQVRPKHPCKAETGVTLYLTAMYCICLRVRPINDAQLSHRSNLSHFLCQCVLLLYLEISPGRTKACRWCVSLGDSLRMRPGLHVDVDDWLKEVSAGSMTQTSAAHGFI